MKGKVKHVRWERPEKESASDHWRSDVHPCKKSYVLADLYDSPHNRIEKNMYIDITKDILEYYGGSRITQKRVDEINKLLHNAWIDYRYDNGSDEDYLDGNLSDYIIQ